jgi:hypothetical protein
VKRIPLHVFFLLLLLLSALFFFSIEHTAQNAHASSCIIYFNYYQKATTAATARVCVRVMECGKRKHFFITRHSCTQYRPRLACVQIWNFISRATERFAPPLILHFYFILFIFSESLSSINTFVSRHRRRSLA